MSTGAGARLRAPVAQRGGRPGAGALDIGSIAALSRAADRSSGGQLGRRDRNDGNHARDARRARFGRGGTTGASHVEGVAGAIGAAAAGGTHAQFILQLVERGTAVAHFALDVAVGHAMADADDHSDVSCEAAIFVAAMNDMARQIPFRWLWMQY